jgi:hypothetical protein
MSEGSDLSRFAQFSHKIAGLNAGALCPVTPLSKPKSEDLCGFSAIFQIACATLLPTCIGRAILRIAR